MTTQTKGDTMTKTAYVKDEETAEDRFFVYVRTATGVTGGGIRFSRRTDAEKIANAINRAWTR